MIVSLKSRYSSFIEILPLPSQSMLWSLYWDPPCFLMILPRYIKAYRSSTPSPSSVIWLLLTMPYFGILLSPYECRGLLLLKLPVHLLFSSAFDAMCRTAVIDHLQSSWHPADSKVSRVSMLLLRCGGFHSLEQTALSDITPHCERIYELPFM